MASNAKDKGRALITGASGGIGLELAREFAGHGHPVILVARNEGRLNEVAAELSRAQGSKRLSSRGISASAMGPSRCSMRSSAAISR
ncbi:MAG: uncharacterized protein QOH65_1267 [Methylobacteriaceae bacterium]|jgi:short-subunit dehydrogenase|nr:uncharacterized protein [Methylobacteriaceae bacterium]